jgi:hypothetical protein
MNWYSRLLQKDSRRSQRASNRRRRLMDLEQLETRTVLSNVSVTFPAPGTASTLLIQGDTFNDNFKITELNNGTVTVAPGTPTLNFKPGVGIIGPSTINSNAFAFNTQNPVSAIIVQLPGTNNFDIVNLNSENGAASPTVGNVTVSAAAPNLTLNVGNPTFGVHNSGFLNVSDIATTNVNGVLLFTENNSSFSSQTINQFGNGPDFSSVTMTGDVTPGRVAVTLGNANADKITLTNDTFGPTTLIEGNGGPANPLAGSSLGNSDTISVSLGKYQTLFAQQKLDGTGNQISISNIQVAFEAPNVPNPAGVTTIQGNGAGDVTTIDHVTTYIAGGLIQNPPPTGVGLASINVTQGNGSVGLAVTNGAHPAAANDVASVTFSTVPGFISISQADVAGNSPSFSMATIMGDSAGGALRITQGNAGGVLLRNSSGAVIGFTQGDQATITTSSGASATISQGTGLSDSAAITLSTIGSGGASITQNDQANPFGDTAQINNDTVAGSDSISQGAASLDVAQVIGGTAGGSVTVTQLDGVGDSARVTLTSIGGNASITQGAGSGDGAILGTPTNAISPATGSIHGNATISQGGGNTDTAVIANLTIGGSIGVTQGNGNNDAGEIETVISTGGTVASGNNPAVPITIGITQGIGNNDIAAIVGLTATGGGTGAAATSIFITQGSGNADWAEVASVTAPNANVTITQADVATNPNGDTAYVLFVNVGVVGSGNTDANGTGTVTIMQGDAPGDVALVQKGSANNVSITQGLNTQTFNGSTVASDVAEVDDETVTSNITITQGSANSLGYYVTAIGFDYVGLAGLGTVPPKPPLFTPLVTPATGSSSVTAGGETSITQFGANNIVLLGDGSNGSSFYTTFLDVFTGNGGGAFVLVANTTTFGPLFQAFSIEAGGTGNTIYMDPSSFFNGVTFDTSAFSGSIG